MNRPYVKQYDAEGKLINPIEGGYYPSKTINQAFPEGFPNRKERRKALVRKDRAFSNKKGIQLVVTYIGMGKFTKYYKQEQVICANELSEQKEKRIIHYIDANRD